MHYYRNLYIIDYIWIKVKLLKKKRIKYLTYWFGVCKMDLHYLNKNIKQKQNDSKFTWLCRVWDTG